MRDNERVQVKGLLQCLMHSECPVLGNHCDYDQYYPSVTSTLFTNGSSNLGKVLPELKVYKSSTNLDPTDVTGSVVTGPANAVDPYLFLN